MSVESLNVNKCTFCLTKLSTNIYTVITGTRCLLLYNNEAVKNTNK